MNTRSFSGSSARNASSILRRGPLSFGLLAIAFGSLVAGCAASPEETDSAGGAGGSLGSPRDDAGPAPMNAGDPGSRSAGHLDAKCPSPEAILAIKGCPDCTVSNVARVDLPMQGRSACTAKVISPSGEGALFTTLDDGTVADEAALLDEERALYRGRYGALTPELARALEIADAEEMIPVWLWARLTLDYPDKNIAIANPEIGKRFAEEAKIKAIAAREPIAAALRERGFRITDEGGSAPMLRALVPARAVRELAFLPEVVALGSDEFPGRPLTTAYYTNDRVSTAQTVSTGTGRGVCLIEANRPDDMSQMEIAGIASPNGAPYWHIRMTSGVVRNTGTTEMAPAASVFVGNWDQYAGTPSAPTVHEWCTSQGATTINFSWSFASGAPEGQNSVDMQEDYFTKLWPYPLYVPAAGNAGCNAGYDTVMNRGHNALVVGGSDDKGTTTIGDDTIYDCSSWRNPTSTHSDRELPYMVAPAVNIDSAGLTATGTSLAAPQVAGTMALVEARGTGFGSWPEMKRALMLAASWRNVDGGGFSNLPAGDIKDGVGLLDSAQAVMIADPTNYRYANSAAAMTGYGNAYLNFATDFTSGISNAKWNLQPLSYGGKIRAAIAWDGSPTCTTSGLSCSADNLDADLDLEIVDTSTGATVCTSGSYDSSWEACNFVATAGHLYRAQIRKYTNNAASTYLGIAWTVYN
ncbi:MAG: S8 family serine peptidase [Polyangiaceae bacterium]